MEQEEKKPVIPTEKWARRKKLLQLVNDHTDDNDSDVMLLVDEIMGLDDTSVRVGIAHEISLEKQRLAFNCEQQRHAMEEDSLKSENRRLRTMVQSLCMGSHLT